jgi:hypothetical protein
LQEEVREGEILESLGLSAFLWEHKLQLVSRSQK